MASTLTTRDARMQPKPVRDGLESVRTRSVKARIDPKPEQKEILIVIEQTRSKLGLSQKAMAINAGCTESELSDALHGRENRRFDAEWLWRQDDTFLLTFLEQVIDARGLTPANVRDIQRRRIVELVDLLLRECA